MTRLIPLSHLLTTGRSSDHPVAFRHQELITFDRFRADVMATVLRLQNVKCAALVCDDSYHFIVGFYGLLHAGAEIILPPNNKSGTLQMLSGEFDLLIDDAWIMANQRGSVNLAPLDADRMALTLLTSGSTGTPKRIFKNLAVLEKEIGTLNALWGESSGNGTVFSTVSHQHIYGMTFKILWPLMAGRPFSSMMHSLWENILEDLVPDAMLVSSPAHLERLDGLRSLAPHQSFKRIFSAGAPLSFTASQKAHTILGCLPTEIFGSTETGAFATRSQTGIHEPWRLLPNINMRCDEDGCLYLLSPFVGKDWHKTDDRIEPVEGGFHALGRADRIVKIEGKRIALTAVEHALEQLPSVKAAVVVALDEPMRLTAALVLSDEGRILLRDMGAFRFSRQLRHELAQTQDAAGIPKSWRFVDALPLQHMGKYRDADIRALFHEES